MNIFIFDPDIKKSAEYFFAKDKRRAQKQIVELAQMLAYAVDLPLTKKDGTFYSTTNKAMKNHPATKWVRANYANINAAALYGLGLCLEYKKLFTKQHACETIFELILPEKFRNILLLQHEKHFTGWQWLTKNPRPHDNIFEAYKIYLQKKLDFITYIV